MSLGTYLQPPLSSKPIGFESNEYCYNVAILFLLHSTSAFVRFPITLLSFFFLIKRSCLSFFFLFLRSRSLIPCSLALVPIHFHSFIHSLSFIHLLSHSQLSLRWTVGPALCVSFRSDVRLIGSQIKQVKNGTDQL